MMEWKLLMNKAMKKLNGGKIEKTLIEGRLFRRIRENIWKFICRTRKNSWTKIQRSYLRLEEKIDFGIGRFFRNRVLSEIPIQDDLIVFCSFQGDYTDNPKYIAEELIRRNTGCELIWIGRKYSADHPEAFPKEFSHVYEWWTINAFYALAKAKVLVVNSVELFKRPYPKKEGQIIIETWHGSLGIKRFDKQVNSGKAWVKAAELTGDICDYLVSNSAFETNIYRNTFWPNQEVWEVGHPRNDCIINCTEKLRADARQRIFCFAKREDHLERLFLYAPTFRDNKQFKCYNLDAEMIKDALEERFGGTWVGVYRYHPTVRRLAVKRAQISKDIIDLTDYPDMQDLLLAADVGITDYSSWIYDYMLTRRPGFIFATDIELYNTERGFCYPLETTPFPIAVNNEEMAENIRSFDNENYQYKLQLFLEEKGCVEHGYASERVVDKILEIVEKRKQTERMQNAG